MNVDLTGDEVGELIAAVNYWETVLEDETSDGLLPSNHPLLSARRKLYTAQREARRGR